MISGIYSITNTINGKTYYGSSCNIDKRWSNHKSKLIENIHPNPHLQSAWNKYGESAFKFDIVKEIPVECLLDEEQSYLDMAKQNPTQFYNISFDSQRSGFNGRVPWNKGIPWSKDMKEKLSVAHIGNRASEETKKKMSKQQIGHFPYNGFDATIYSFSNVDSGDTFEGTRRDFIKKYNLLKGSVKNLIREKCNVKSVKGWVLV